MTINYLNDKSRTGIISYIKEACQAMNNGADNITATNNTMFNIVDKTLSYGKSTTDSLKLLANQMQDIVICNGYLSKRPDIFRDINAEKYNTIVDTESLSIRLARKQISIEDIKAVNIYTNNKAVDFNLSDILTRDGSGIIVESVNTRTTIIIDIMLKKEAIVSEIDISMLDMGLKLPKIAGIVVTTSSNTIEKPVILNSNDYSYQLTLNNSQVRINPTVAKNIRITLIQDDSELLSQQNVFRCNIKSLSVGLAQSYEKGWVIFGPIKSSDPILKAGIAFNTTNYGSVKASISNNKEDWIYIHNTKDITPDTKIANYNNIDINSKLLSEEVKSIYVRFEITASTLMPTNLIDKYIVRLLATTNGYAESTYEEEYNLSAVYKILDHGYGKIKTGTFNLSKISVPYGIIGSNKLSLIGDDSIFTDRQLRLMFDMDSLIASGNVVKTKDAYAGNDIKISSVSKPVWIKVSTESTYEACIPVGIRNDMYRIKYGEYEWHIDLRSGFISSMEILNLKANSGDSVLVFDSIGELIATVNASNINNEYIISLYDTLMTAVPDTRFNKYYPYSQTAGNFGISKGKIDAGGTKLADVNIFVIYRNQIPISLTTKTVNKEIKLSKIPMARYTQSIDYFKFTNNAKLKHCNITEGSVSVDTSQCAIPSMETEVKFVDGIKEFDQLEIVTVNIDSALNEISIEKAIPNDSQITFSGEKELFTNRVYDESELYFSGDYFVDNVSKKIKLPAGIYTTSYIKTEIAYEGRGETGMDRLYSVDYVNGIIYTYSQIAENTTVSYSHSLVYASYNAVEELDEAEYTDTGSSVIINTDADTLLLELLPKDNSMNGTSVSPTIKNIDIKYTV